MPDGNHLGRVLITGGTGFIGSHLVAALVNAGHRPVLLARQHGGRLANSLHQQVDWRLGDLTDAVWLEDALGETAPDSIFHLAGTRGTGGAEAALECTDLNVQATVRLLAAAHRTGARRAILVGSAEEYGDQPGPLHEELPLEPETPYGITKAAATRLALAMGRSGACRTTVLRPFTVYGPGQPAHMFVAQAVKSALAGEKFQMTHGRQRRDLVFVADVVRALLAAAENDGVAGKVVNVGTGAAWALCDVARLIWELTGSRAVLDIGGRPAPAVELRDTWADISRARDLLGWQPQESLEAGLRMTIDWARRKGEGREQVCPAR